MAKMFKLDDHLQQFDLENPFLDSESERKVKNIDLLFKSLNQLHLALIHKLEQAEQNNDEKLIAFYEGQIAGYKFSVTIVESFFDI